MLALGGGAAGAATRFLPVRVAGTVDGRLKGVWRDRAEGWVLDLRGPKPALYNETRADCLRDRTPSADIFDGLATYWRGGRDHIVLTIEPGDYENHFGRLPALPAACAHPPKPTPEAVFDSLVASFSEHYPHFRARHVDWTAAVAAAREKLRPNMNDAELFALLSDLLRPLDDSHVTLSDPKDDSRTFAEGFGPTQRAWGNAFAAKGYKDFEDARRGLMTHWIESVQKDVLHEKGATAENGRLFYGFAAPGIAYLAPTAFYDTGKYPNWRAAERGYDRALDKAFASFAGAKALIIDLSNHRGGDGQMGRQIAGRVGRPARVAAYIRAANSDGPLQTWRPVSSAGHPGFKGPVYVLISDITVSAGEFTTLWFMTLPNALVLGEPTRGSVSGLTEKVLPNGWIMEMPNLVITTPAGQDFGGIGIPPEVPLTVYGRGIGDPIALHSAAIRQVVEHFTRCEPHRSDLKPCW